MTHIQFVVPSLGLGGAERSLIKLTNKLVKSGYSVSVIGFAAKQSSVIIGELDDRVRIEMIRGGRSSNPLVWFRLALVTRRDRPDVIFGWSLFANLIVCLIGRFFRDCRVVISERVYLPEVLRKASFRTRLRRRLIWTLIRVLYPTATAITANSNTNLTLIRRFLGPITQYRLLPNIIEIQNVESLGSDIVDARLSGIEPRILSVGRLHYQKGFDLLLRAFAIVRRRRKWSLVIVGDGPERQALVSLATDLGISEHVIWIGSLANPFPYYRWSNMVVVASRYEGFPNVPLEAMATGRAVICTDCKTGPRELLSNGRFGRLVPCNDPVAMANAIVRLGDDHNAREYIGSSGRQHVQKNYSAARAVLVVQEIIATR